MVLYGFIAVPEIAVYLSLFHGGMLKAMHIHSVMQLLLLPPQDVSFSVLGMRPLTTDPNSYSNSNIKISSD
jgi:hypothetical protein